MQLYPAAKCYFLLKLNILPSILCSDIQNVFCAFNNWAKLHFHTKQYAGSVLNATLLYVLIFTFWEWRWKEDVQLI
jgi:hypothetical protein